MGVKIDIDGKWGIMSDKFQYILGQWTTKTRQRDGEEVEVKTLTDRTFHDEITHLLKTYTRKRTNNEEIESFEELKELHKEIKEIFEDIREELVV